MSSAIGIDIGSSRAVIGVVQKGGVEVICNESSYRDTPTIIGYGNLERLAGDLAKAKMKTNLKNTISSIPRFLNLELNSPELAVERKHTFMNIVAGPNNRVAFKVDFQGETHVLTAEQALGAYLNKIAGIVKFNGMDCREFVLTYPNYFSEFEKEALLNAAKIGGIKVARLASETECNVKNYGIFRRSDIKDTKRLVLFVDLGHSKTSVYISEFTNQKANVIYENHNRHLGARDIDLVVYDVYQEQFEKQTGNLIDENPKARMRMLEAIEKQRKVLSANEDAGCNVEYLIDEEDFSANLTREQFEKLAGPFFERFKGFLTHCVNESKVNLKELHSVEVIGGATRMPMIQEIIKQVSGIETISKTLNASENCSRGAAVLAAEVSTFFRVAPFPVVLKNHHPIQIKYQVQKDEGVIEKTGTLFKYGCEPPLNMSVTCAKTSKTVFDIYYEDTVPHRSTKELFHVETQQAVPKHEDYKLILRCNINDNHMIGVKAVELEENFVEEQKKLKADKKDKKPEEPENPDDYEITKVGKTHTSSVKFTVTRPHQIDEQTLQQWVKLETDMVKIDTIILETNKAKNDLESYLYNVKDKLTSDWKQYITEEETRKISAKRDELDAWISNEGVLAGKDAYSAKVAEISALVTSVTDREKHHAQFADSVVYLYNKVQQYSSEAPEVEKNVSYFEKFKNLVTLKVIFFSYFEADSNPRLKSMVI